MKKVIIYFRISRILRSYHTAELASVAQFALIPERLQACNSVKKRLQHTSVFLWMLRILKNTYFEEHLRTAACKIPCTHFFISML